nr:hypothetical protein [Micromonospora sp. DSM 115978]
MTIELEDLGNGSAKPARFAGKYRGARRENLPREDLDTGAGLGAVDPAALELVGSPELPGGPMEMAGIGESTSFPVPDWTANTGESLVEHPLLRGLLLELPPRGTAPGVEWLDRWFEAARSILELLYVQETVRPR